MKKSEQYILFAIGALILIIGGLSFLYIDKRLTSSPYITSFTPSPSHPSTIIIHVAGRVKRPGVYKLPSGSRVYEAIKVAGGGLKDADMDALNLARPLKDGERLFVPERSVTYSSLKPKERGIDINTMDKDELMKLPGIGEKLAERIIKYRETHGPFKSIDELINVSGIGEKKLKEIRDYLNSL